MNESPATTVECNTYNSRLFGGGRLRSFYHLARFRWVAEKMRACSLNDLRFLELGCFDGRLLDEIDDHVSEYVGLDANWEHGLDLARRKFGGRQGVTLIETTNPSPLRKYREGYFNAAAALETLEHVPPAMVNEYLDEIARITKGYFFVSVPNELGAIFLAKYSAKRLLYRDVQCYSWKELAAATLGRTDLVERVDHKGFDYRLLIEELRRRFVIHSIEGLPKLGLPARLSATIAIVASNT